MQLDGMQSVRKVKGTLSKRAKKEAVNHLEVLQQQ